MTPDHFLRDHAAAIAFALVFAPALVVYGGEAWSRHLTRARIRTRARRRTP